MVICTCGLLPNPAKVPNFQYRAWLYSMDQKFHGDDEKTWESRFWDLFQWPTAIIRPKSQNSNIRHDGILSIVNFMLMINNHFTLFQLPGNLSKTKKMCSLFSWQHAISYLFSFLLNFFPFFFQFFFLIFCNSAPLSFTLTSSNWNCNFSQICWLSIKLFIYYNNSNIWVRTQVIWAFGTDHNHWVKLICWNLKETSLYQLCISRLW
jgi:hypothetical protein